MTEIEQLRADIEKLEKAMPIAKRLGAQATCATLGALKSEIEFELAKLESEAADPHKHAKVLAGRWLVAYASVTDENMVAKYVCHLEQRVAELEAELAKRPVVYCLRNKATGKYNQFAIHAGIALYDRNDFATFDQWEFEPYTGQQS